MLENAKLENKKEVAVYIRFANYNPDNEGLIENQRASLRFLAEQHGLDSLAEYIDNGYNGNTLDRPAFLKMDADIKAGKVEAVIVRSIDRVARNFMLAENWISGLEKSNVKFIAADGSHDRPNFALDIFQDIMRSERRRKKQKKQMK